MSNEAPFAFSKTRAETSDLIHQARSVIELEAHALERLSAGIGESFADAVRLLTRLEGRLVVTGIGKSGHVARKIASTLASTGTPALFMHAAEASHGDLGMLTRADALLILSNSGATLELVPVIAHAKALGISIVAISAREHAALMREADVKLLLPLVNEACASNLAPTTSTTMMMALGDALAVATMRARGVTRDAFRLLHPGGNIGSRLAQVSSVMHGPARMPLVRLDAPMRDVILIMTERSFGIAGVVDDAGQLVGVITDGDLRRHIDDNLFAATAGTVMTLQPITIDPTSNVEDALALMNQRKITALFVTEEFDRARPIGIVHIHDFLRLGSA